MPSDPAPPSTHPVFAARAITKVYHMGEVEVQALRGVSLELRESEFVVLLGPSGSGKSTLLNILGGLDVPTSGTVTYRGQNLTTAGERALTMYRRKHVGFVFQFYNLIPVLTAVENVELTLLVSGVTPKAARARALEALTMVGLEGRAPHLPEELSGGERQRVTIARSLVNEPALVWADEPTGDLDSEKAADVVALMRSLNVERGLTFVIVTHDIAVGRATDRIVRMLDGRVVDVLLPEVTDVRPHHAA
jgi:putative ABC transport system ATP-binding protein